MSNPERWRRFEALPDDLRERLDALPGLFERHGIVLAYLFGSLAEPADREPRDVDLALLIGDGEVGSLREPLRQALGTERLDLVDLRRAPPVLRFHVVRDGRLLFARDDAALNRFELATLHLYRDTAPLRRRQGETLRKRMDAWS